VASKETEARFIFGESHRFRKTNFWENALSDKSERHTGAETSPDMAVAVPAQTTPLRAVG
jgi:hypothetical protein